MSTVRVSALAILILSNLAQASPTTQPAIEQRLDERIADINMEGMTLKQLVTTLRETTRLNIFVNWNELVAAGVDSDVKLEGRLSNVRVRTVLQCALASIGGATKLCMQVEGEVVWIGTSDHPNVELRVYNIGKLLTTLANEQKQLQGEPGDLQERIDSIIKVISTTVAPEVWRDNGGTVGSISAVGTRLCIVQTPENHAAIGALLDKLEKPDGK